MLHVPNADPSMFAGDANSGRIVAVLRIVRSSATVCGTSLVSEDVTEANNKTIDGSNDRPSRVASRATIPCVAIRLEVQGMVKCRIALHSLRMGAERFEA